MSESMRVFKQVDIGSLTVRSASDGSDFYIGFTNDNEETEGVSLPSRDAAKFVRDRLSELLASGNKRAPRSDKGKAKVKKEAVATV